MRVVSNMNLGAYDVHEASAAWPEPDWKILPPFHEMIKIAFGTQFINNLDHPVLRQLRGEE